MSRKTKIVATLGPATDTPDLIEQLIVSGVDVVRMNFSHGAHEDHAARFERVREISKEKDRSVTILQDLQGPKIRTGPIEGGTVELVRGRPLTLTVKEVLGTAERVSIDFPELPLNVKPGSRVLLADGQMELVVTEVDKEDIHTQVILGGELAANKGVNLPGTSLDIPSFTDKDEEDLTFGMELGVDAVAMSFIRTSEDVTRVKKAIDRLCPTNPPPPVIAKMERPEALDNLEGILHVTDGVMVARGDLGVEMSTEAVPIAQKQIIEAANKHGKVVITATQMLESMMDKPRPTRAEASDVANAIFDGTDAVMLSGETAVGQYPVSAVQVMDKIIQRAEAHLREWGHEAKPAPDHTDDDPTFITRAACELALDRNVSAIAVFTRSGRTARLMSKARPQTDILAFTPEESTYRRLPLYWGITPYLVPSVDNVEEMLATVEKTMIKETHIQPGQQVVLICGFPVGAMRPPNLALLHTVRTH